ncbi:DNA internalization-related competence protein ComEC/Rec2 [Halomonas cupida]|uniref:DNA internalization-related competence protein ComEC/Rec2 n=1 Tax=Halomonas cupida TaxID=44933 RepID=A0ABQ0WCX5_9GAMM|nr:DNA internalization-related competence protein ComEC/Rec2 [Halomonas cupida]GEN22553.1 DNA internalization-related competence protein ComEC/Rec2 [Halomonas cupida]
MRLPATFALALGALGGAVAFHGAEIGLPLMGLVLMASMAARRVTLVASGLMALWVLCSLLQSAGGQLPEGLVGEPLLIEARVEALHRFPNMQRMTLAIDDCRPIAEGLPDCRKLKRVRVTWYGARSQDAAGSTATDDVVVEQGERWQWVVRLRPGSGMANATGFDYERWLWRRGIQATGSVASSEQAVRLESAPVDARDGLLNYLLHLPLEDHHRRWLAALTLGVGQQLSDDEWSMLRDTGTTHLAVVSGLHVGMVALLVLVMARLVARLLYPRRWRLLTWPWWGAALMISGYAWLVGAEPPVLRALIMSLVGLWVASGWHSPSPWQGLALAFTGVVVLDPLALWHSGLWLSFGAVALLILIWQGRDPGSGAAGTLHAIWRTQWLLAPLVAGLVLLAFGLVTALSPLLNLFAVPWLTLVVVPLGMLGWLTSVIWPSAGVLVWQLAGQAIDVLVWALSVAAEFQGVVWYPEESPGLRLAMVMLSIAVVMALPGLAWRLRLVLGMGLLVAALVVRSDTPAPGEARVVVWDVGQGLMVEVQTAHHRLLFDSGPRFSSGFAPLQSFWRSSQQFDAVVISHADLDHAGGVSSLLNDHRVEQWYYPEAESLVLPQGAGFSHCRHGLGWRWDGVEFRFLWPPAGDLQTQLSANDRSCVLELEVAGRRILVPGDAGKRTERFWMGAFEGALDVLVAGHHGSATSTGAALVAARPPAMAIFSAGRYNAAGHPADEVVRRLRRAGSCLLSTALDGQIRLYVDDAGRISWRARRRPLVVGAVEGPCHGVESGH